MNDKVIATFGCWIVRPNGVNSHCTHNYFIPTERLRESGWVWHCLTKRYWSTQQDGIDLGKALVTARHYHHLRKPRFKDTSWYMWLPPANERMREITMLRRRFEGSILGNELSLVNTG